MRKNGTLNFILGDHLGSSSLVTDSSGAVMNESKYKAWGELVTRQVQSRRNMDTRDSIVMSVILDSCFTMHVGTTARCQGLRRRIR